MYGLKLSNGSVVGRMSLVRAFLKQVSNPRVVKGIVRLVDFKQLRVKL